MKNKGSDKMRDIEFRGFDLDSKRWFYGYYVKHIDQTPCVFESEKQRNSWFKKHTKHLIVFDGFSDWWMPRNIQMCDTIDPKSIGQYTEIYDKNKKRIYEGDIVKFEDKKICWVHSINGSFWLDDEKHIDTKRLVLNDSPELEIIGNIYENPELLLNWSVNEEGAE